MAIYGLTAPDKPKDWSNQEKVQEYLDKKADYRAAIQAINDDRREESAMKSNLQKANYDAMMAIIANLK